MTELEQRKDTYSEPLVLTDEDRVFLSAIQDPEKRERIIKILVIAWWRKRCRDNPGLGDTPEAQIAYFRELGHEDYADCLQKLLINGSEHPSEPEGVHGDIE